MKKLFADRLNFMFWFFRKYKFQIIDYNFLPVSKNVIDENKDDIGENI
jgi:hypothetical protein